MLSSLYTAATGMLGQQLSMDIVANNLANANTAGYKRSQVAFADLMYQNFPTGAGNDIQIGRGTRVNSTDKIFQQGTIQQTGNQFDLAIEGAGFFTVQLADGRFGYTRAGNFSVDADGNVVLPGGARLYPPIRIPANTVEVSIGADGDVNAVGANGQRINVGRIQIVNFPNAQGLLAGGDNLFFESAASGRPTLGNPGTGGLGFLRQGFVERSNVNVVDEMVQMIITQRTYELNSKVVQTSDNMLGTAVNMRP